MAELTCVSWALLARARYVTTLIPVFSILLRCLSFSLDVVLRAKDPLLTLGKSDLDPPQSMLVLNLNHILDPSPSFRRLVLRVRVKFHGRFPRRRSGGRGDERSFDLGGWLWADVLRFRLHEVGQEALDVARFQVVGREI
jgi:hypothetical protein